MPLPPLNIYRHDRRTRALITLAGEIDLETVPLMRTTLERCLRDGVRTIDVDLTPVTFCDCSGLNAFVETFLRTAAAGGALHLHYPPPMLAWMIELTGSGFLLGDLPAVPGPVSRPAVLFAAAPVPLPVAGFETSHRLVPAVSAVSGGVL
ncbi:STAS domain-containing protein [Streptomyces kanamyceticus]|uniref:Anti-sigma factor antagonist n=1 Tax=Streptomyces kanamyceticus TaxID=1967 RepID=A0A5J6GA02_STRKN|nr:STAS domain-containing protein [Streptomyces kanamyceticus]QEU90775.1 anti-sigma factor antagonist [Streptomyces kanamyceticus]